MKRSILPAKSISSSVTRCGRCTKGSIVTDLETGELICGMCGYVLSERIEDFGPEHRNFLDGSVDKSRTGDAVLLSRHDRGLSTIINRADRDATGKILNSSMKNTIHRLRIWDAQSQARTSHDINLRRAFDDLDRLKDKLQLSYSIIEKAAYIYRKAVDKKIIRGRSISALIAASVYVACRDAETPRTLGDIELAGNIRRKELSKCYRLLIQELDLKIPQINPIQCVTRAANILGVSEKTKRCAIDILNEYKKHGTMGGKSPISVAATALYLATNVMNQRFSQKQVADAANVTEVTIRNRSKEMKETMGYSISLLQNNIGDDDE